MPDNSGACFLFKPKTVYFLIKETQMNTIQFDEKVECGPEFVALRILDNLDEM